VVATDIRNLADEEVMQLVGDGSPLAFELLYDRHGAAAFSLAYRMVGDRVTAEDVSQEAFLSIWRSRMRYDPSRGSVRTWVLGIVHNRTIDAPEQRRTIELAYFGGFSHSQIAELLDEPIGTIKGRMRLGLDKLRQQLADFATGEFA
jgi:RNA polymerase sigma-70 factor, ECF subfamily